MYVTEAFYADLSDPQRVFLKTVAASVGSYFEDHLSHWNEQRKELAGANKVWPLYLIGTRDCFAHDLRTRETTLRRADGREYIKKEFFFPSVEDSPVRFRFSKYCGKKNPELRAGMTTYEGFFTHEELKKLEESALDTDSKALNGEFLPNTAHHTVVRQRLTRTKFFFEARYLWTSEQLSHPSAKQAAGVRIDVSRSPEWVKGDILHPMIEHEIIPNNFINSVALNIYHDGSEGIGQHFDDWFRFDRPITTVRLFSDSRLSFGSKLFGFTNSEFYVPLPRGCIAVMERTYSFNPFVFIGQVWASLSLSLFLIVTFVSIYS